MKKQGIDSTHEQQLEILEKPCMKIYHAPLLTSWGNLQDITMGPGNQESDDGFSGSYAGRPWEENSNPSLLNP